MSKDAVKKYALAQINVMRKMTRPMSLGLIGKEPKELIKHIETALSLPAGELHKNATRKTEIVEGKKIAIMLISKLYPRMPLQKIADMFPGYDHTMIVHHRKHGFDLLEGGDPMFSYKFENALNAVEEWIKE